jgi:hypothetical protein
VESGIRTSSSSASTLARIAGRDRSVWMENISPIWSPTVRSGLSAVIGSWKIMAMPAPRTPRISAIVAVARSRPSKCTLPPSMVISFGSSRMMALAMIDLPEPDSPTTQRISLAAMDSETFDSACGRSAPAGNRTLSRSRVRMAFSGSLIAP